MSGPAPAPGSSPYQGVPLFGTPLVDPRTGFLTTPWHRFFVALWQKTGNSRAPLPGLLYVTQAVTGQLQAFQALTNQLVSGGFIPIINPQPPVALVPGISPFVFTAAVIGTFLGFGARIDLKRGSAGTYFPVTLTGGAVPMLPNDAVQLTWFGTDVPVATWFPSQ